MTLLEVMVALAIVALIVGLTAPRLIENLGKAKSKAAEVALNNVKGALQIFYIDIGRYPTQAEGLYALINQPAGLQDWQGPYISHESFLNDPWGRTFIYKNPGKENTIDLFSYGRDGYPGGNKEDKDISL